MSNKPQQISVRGAREHNLKNISIDIPHNKISVITGLSGSGKSSLAFDTIYAEGQRRYIESMSSYARNFLEQFKKPLVDSISGLCPSLSIDQKTNSTSPRSTVGTVTELYDYLRLLFAKVGVPHCPQHKVPVQSQSSQQIIDDILKLPPGTKFFVLAPMAQDKKGEFHNEFTKWTKQGFLRAKVDGQYIDLSTAKKLAKTKKHDIDLLIDRLLIKDHLIQRMRESVNTALVQSKGQVIIELMSGERKSYSIHRACPQCGFSYPNYDHRFFSFNNPRGACDECNGLGYIEYEYEYETEEEEDLYTEFKKEPCPKCHGLRLKEGPLSVFIGNKNIAELTSLSATQLSRFFKDVQFSDRSQIIADKILQQIESRLSYMQRVGVGYLSTDRATRTLSGGEAQRIRLATQIGSSLVGVLYVLDEPSIGLHPRDHHRLLDVIKDLNQLGNTIIIVEHDEDTIRAADFIIDLGPRAGVHGGEITAVGTPEKISEDANSLTGNYLSQKKYIPLPTKRRKQTNSDLFIDLKGARGHNLKNFDLRFPLQSLITVTGVSGSGKSTLIIDTLYRAIANHLHKTDYPTSAFDEISGLENLDRVVEINQRPIGRTPRSNPATYVGLLPLIRNLYAQHPESRMRGYQPGRFSFNVKGGRCEACQGAGVVKVEMHFLSNVFVPCDLCNGRKYNRETLNILYRDKSIADVLDMTVGEALDFFKNHKHILKKLETLHRVGLDYITLGQSATTLSGGEAQRVKLSKELSKRSTGKTIYILDEPTTGLHFDDIAKLVELLHELVDQKNTVIVIEHNLDVIKNADFLIDLGPEGGENGGELLFAGPPEGVVKEDRSATGKFLKNYLR